jgi:hypothetical protein
VSCYAPVILTAFRSHVISMFCGLSISAARFSTWKACVAPVTRDHEAVSPERHQLSVGGHRRTYGGCPDSCRGAPAWPAGGRSCRDEIVLGPGSCKRAFRSDLLSDELLWRASRGWDVQSPVRVEPLSPLVFTSEQVLDGRGSSCGVS